MDEFRLIADEPAAPATAPVKPAKAKRVREPVVRRLGTPLEIARANALSDCRFTPGTFHKRFARETCSHIALNGIITQKQAECIERMAWTYRRQLPPQLVPGAQPPLPWKKTIPSN